MKIKVLLLALGCTMGTLGAYAQKGVDTGTRFGHGEDSIRCITNISLFTPYAKGGNYKDALEFWKIAYEECPAATKDIYLYGVRIVGWQIENEKDPAKKAQLIDDLMAVYDKRVKYFGNDKRYGKDWIVANKAEDYIKYAGANVDADKLYGWLKEILDEYGNKCEVKATSLYLYASLKKLQADPNLKDQFIQDYLKCSGIINAQIEAAKAANNQKEVKTLEAYQANVETNFASSGAADCETLENVYGAKVEEKKDDLAFLKQTIALLRKSRCQEIEVYFKASGYAHAIEPTAESAVGLAKQAVKKEDYATAIKFFEEAVGLETDAAAKAEDYYMMALLSFDQNHHSQAREYCRKAISENANYGAPYMLIGKMYAATAKSVYPDDPVLQRAVYYAAIDKFQKAMQVDPENCTEEAKSLIGSYHAHLPSTEEIFMHPDLEKGKTFTVGGWIGETTTIR